MNATKLVPQSLGNYDVHGALVTRLMAAAHRQCAPHLLLYGPPGVGKTTLARLYAKELLGALDDTNFMELNASDERGIDVVRVKIKTFASLKSLATKLKVLLLDEADFITKDAQSTLRAIMVDYRNECKFILTCNSIDKLDTAIKSRTFKNYVPALNLRESEIIAKKLCNTSDTPRSEAFIKSLALASEGDIRYIDNNLSANAHELVGSAQIAINVLTRLKANEGPIKLSLVEQQLGFGIYARILKADFEALNPSKEKYVALLDLLAETDRRITDGADRSLQLSWCLTHYLLLTV